MSESFVKTLITSSLGTVTVEVSRVQGSNILTLARAASARIGLRQKILPVGTILVPDWRHGSNEPCYMAYDSLYAALRGGANALASQKANFGRHASSSGRYELVFGDRLSALDEAKIKSKAEKRLAGQVGIARNLSLWQMSLWLERESSLAALLLLKQGANNLLTNRLAWPVFKRLAIAELGKLHCAPFVDFARASLFMISGMHDARLEGATDGFVSFIEEFEGCSAGMLRDQSLEDIDACLSRAGSRIRRQNGSWKSDADGAFVNSYTLLSLAEAGHVWKAGEIKKLHSVRSRVGMVRKALLRNRVEAAKTHLGAARAILNALIER
jgi:hypothetical protein